jgi:hypothetical protein
MGVFGEPNQLQHFGTVRDQRRRLHLGGCHPRKARSVDLPTTKRSTRVRRKFPNKAVVKAERGKSAVLADWQTVAICERIMMWWHIGHCV